MRAPEVHQVRPGDGGNGLSGPREATKDGEQQLIRDCMAHCLLCYKEGGGNTRVLYQGSDAGRAGLRWRVFQPAFLATRRGRARLSRPLGPGLGPASAFTAA